MDNKEKKRKKKTLKKGIKPNGDDKIAQQYQVGKDEEV